MAKNKKPPPTLIIHGKEYEFVFLRVDLYNEDGSPLQATILRMDDAAQLDKDPSKNHFVSGYIRKDAKRPDYNREF